MMNLPRVGDKIRAKMSGDVWGILEVRTERTWEGRRYDVYVVKKGAPGYELAIGGDDLLKYWEVVEETG